MLFRRIFGCAVIFLALAAGAARADDIVAGPMIGHVTDHSARVWVELATAEEVTVECYDISNDNEVCAISTDASGPSPFTADVPLSDLQPNKSYRISIKIDGQPVRLPTVGKGGSLPDCVIRTNPPAGQQSILTVGFGSGFNPSNGGAGGGTAAAGSEPAQIFKAVNDVNPRAFLFLGNATCLPEKMPDFRNNGRRAFRFIADAYSATRRQAELQTLFRTTACYAVWDDRDFGSPDSNKTWEFTDESWAVFQRFWPNPDWGTTKDKGCYFSFSLGDADFFALDSRFHRDPAGVGAPAADAGPRSMLGAAQLEWLKRSLLNSQASFKIIACGSQLLGNDVSAAGTATAGLPCADTWAAFQPEQRDFLQWLGAQHIPGVLFITGSNRGYGELTVLRAKDSPTGYPLLELTSSGLAGRGASEDAVAALTSPALASPPVADNNFGTLDFGGEGDHRFITLRLRDATGKIRVEQTAFLSQLRRN